MTPNKNKIFTKELKTKFTRAAFQQWRIVVQGFKIEELKSSTKVAIKSNQHNLSADAPIFVPNSFGNNESLILMTSQTILTPLATKKSESTCTVSTASAPSEAYTTPTSVILLTNSASTIAAAVTTIRPITIKAG